MGRDLFSWLEAEIDRLRQRHAGLLRERAEAQELQAMWTLRGDVLRWHVVLDDVAEPDIDVEIVSEAFIVRARPLSRREGLLVGLLPVPAGFDLMRPEIRCEEGFLEIQVLRIERGRR
jgi:hypothetical protein